MDLNKKVSIKIEQEELTDIPGIRAVNLAAFDQTAEVNLVDQLRKSSPIFLSIVAKIGEQIVGHILFTPATIIQNNGDRIAGMALGPLAVLSAYQGQGIGSALCRAGLARIQKQGAPFVIVLGHPNYYPRFGFKKASLFSISCAYEDVPDDAFMICIFDSQRMMGVTGKAFYREEFDTVT